MPGKVRCRTHAVQRSAEQSKRYHAKKAALLALTLLAGCADAVIVTPRYWTCDQESTCDPGAACLNLRGESYCTTLCKTTDDCLTYGWPAICSDGACWGECWPGDPEDLAFCRKYGFLCPSDCAAQGLVCNAVAGAPLPRYGCVKGG